MRAPRRTIVAVLARVLVLAFFVFAPTFEATAAEIKVAVASNFLAAREVARSFEETTGHRVTLIFGSTGKHYAQIRNGAPFDVFLAADADHPRRLEAEGLAVSESSFTYAVGALVLWSPDDNLVDTSGKVLEHSDFRYLAIANPKLAPYGEAAREVLEARGLWESIQHRIVRGENIAQALQFVSSGNAELGFVALAQIARAGRGLSRGSSWRVPQELYRPIEQRAVLLEDSDAARSFIGFIRGTEARAIIREHGYTTP